MDPNKTPGQLAYEEAQKKPWDSLTPGVKEWWEKVVLGERLPKFENDAQDKKCIQIAIEQGSDNGPAYLHALRSDGAIFYLNPPQSDYGIPAAWVRLPDLPKE